MLILCILWHYDYEFQIVWHCVCYFMCFILFTQFFWGGLKLCVQNCAIHAHWHNYTCSNFDLVVCHFGRACSISPHRAKLRYLMTTAVVSRTLPLIIFNSSHLPTIRFLNFFPGHDTTSSILMMLYFQLNRVRESYGIRRVAAFCLVHAYSDPKRPKSQRLPNESQSI